jgi:hypothetical protein
MQRRYQQRHPDVHQRSFYSRGSSFLLWRITLAASLRVILRCDLLQQQ